MLGGAGGGIIEKWIENKNITKFYYNYCFATEYLQNTVTPYIKELVKELYPTATVLSVSVYAKLGQTYKRLVFSPRINSSENHDMYLFAGVTSFDVNLENGSNYWAYSFDDMDKINELLAPCEISKEEFLERISQSIN